MNKMKNLYQVNDFCSMVRGQLNTIRPGEYGLVCLDFDHFSTINSLFGYEMGDEVLKQMEQVFSQELAENEFFSRTHGDNFKFWVYNNPNNPIRERFLALTELCRTLTVNLPDHYEYVCSGGIVIVDCSYNNIVELLDKAEYTRTRAKGGDTTTILYYDNLLEQEYKWKNIITLSMRNALVTNEFQMYLQPKVLIRTSEVVGAEALSRWNSKEHGMIYPDRFIPILEQNGFIEYLDFYILEKACKFLKKSIQLGKKVLPISINFSKAYMGRKDFVESVFQTVNRCGIPARLIEIEMTESMMSDNFQRLINIANELKYLGFRVSLDDFGSAYSSLNFLKELPFDVIKIDKEFLNTTTDTDKGRVIISKVVELIKSIRMTPVMEGIETQEQVDFLNKLSCDIGQGYYYSKPLPVHEYETYLEEHDVQSEKSFRAQGEEFEDDASVYTVPEEFQMDNWELYVLGQNIDMGLMKGNLDDEITMQYVNDRALEYFGYSRKEFREIFHNSILGFTYPEDIPIVHKNFNELIATGKPLKFSARAIRKDGKVIVLQGSSSCVMDNNGCAVGIHAFQDVTEELEKSAQLKQSLEDKVIELNELISSEKKSKEALRLSEERYRIVVEQSGDIMFEWNFETDIINFSEKFKNKFNRPPIGINVTTNEEIRKTIHPEDRGAFEKWVKKTYEKPGINKAEYRVKSNEDEYFWQRVSSMAICDDTGKPIKAVGIFSDITNQKAEMNSLVKKAQLDPLTQLYNKAEHKQQVEKYLHRNPKQPGAFLILDIDNFKGLNDNLGHQFGDTVLQEVADNIKQIFSENDIVGRVGGDEMSIFVCDADEEVIHKKAAYLTEKLHTTYFGELTQYQLSVSVGIAYYPVHGTTFFELYRMADTALYESKHNGKNQYTIYNEKFITSKEETRTPFYSSEHFLNTYFSGDLPFSIFEMLYETKDIHTTIRIILEHLGRKFQVDHVYIFEKDENGQQFNNTSEWCAPGISSEMTKLQEIPAKVLQPFLNKFNAEGIMYCSDVAELSSEVIDIVNIQKIKSLLCCEICKDGKNIGFIGFDDCKNKRVWHGEEIALLGYVSRILSVFMLQNQTIHELVESNENHLEMLENMNGFVYVIDVATFELLYINKKMRNLDARIGQKCYEFVFDSDGPCVNCPVSRINADNPSATEEIYSEMLNGWVSSVASKLKWDGSKEAALISCMDISKYKK